MNRHKSLFLSTFQNSPIEPLGAGKIASLLLYREQIERLVLEPLRLPLTLFVSITIAFTASALACSVIRENTCRAVTQLVVVINFSFVVIDIVCFVFFCSYRLFFCRFQSFCFVSLSYVYFFACSIFFPW